jgi:ABC-type transport system involved in multi-copper enzyme maturation permease subunit
LFVGPVFTRELATAPRRARLYLARAAYVAVLLVLMATAWQVLAGTQEVRNVGDLARFGAVVFQILAPLQLAVVMFFAALAAASAVAAEKDRQTLILLLLTNLSNMELVLGKLLASMLNVLVLISSALPVFMLLVLLGGVSFEQVARVFAVTVAGALAAGSLGALLAFWREKTFQTLAITVLVLVCWTGLNEGVARGMT